MDVESTGGALERRRARRLRLAESLTQGATHPLPVKRALEVDRFANSAQYHGIIRRGAPIDAA